MSSLTTGVLLVGFMVQLGATNFSIGLLAAAPFAVQFLQLPGVVLVERIRARRAICAWALTEDQVEAAPEYKAPEKPAHVVVLEVPESKPGQP